MEQFFTILQVQLTLFVYLIVGFVARKRGFVTDGMQTGITNLTLSILLPCMVFHSFQMNPDEQKLLSALAMLGIAVALSLFAWLVGLFFYRGFPEEKKKILRYGTLVANTAFAGLPLVQGAYGAEGLFYASVFIIPNRVAMWSAGISIFTGKGEGRLKSVLLNPGIIAVFLGLTRMLAGIPVPSFLDTAVASLGNCSNPLSFLLIGSILADVDLKHILAADTLWLSFVRLIFLPVCALLALRAVRFDGFATAVAVVLTGMPMGSITVVLAEKYGADSVFAAKCTFITTLFSLITIPLLSVFL